MIACMTMHFVPEQRGSFVPEFTLGDRLRKAREVADLDQAQLAAELGISRNSVVNYEADRTRIKRPVLVSWALRTGVDLAWLAGSDATPPTKRPRRDSNAGPMAYKNAGSHLRLLGRQTVAA